MRGAGVLGCYCNAISTPTRSVSVSEICQFSADYWALIKCKCVTYKVQIHGANVCVKCECVNIKTGFSEDHENFYTLISGNRSHKPAGHDVTSCFRRSAAKCNRILHRFAQNRYVGGHRVE